MQWIICRQISKNDLIRYVTSDYPDEAQFLVYLKFLEFIGNFHIKNFDGFINTLNEFKFIVIYPELMFWEEFVEEKPKEATFEELLELNNINKKKESKIEKLKKYIFSKSKIKTENGLSYDSIGSSRSSSNINREWKRGIRIQSDQSRTPWK